MLSVSDGDSAGVCIFSGDLAAVTRRERDGIVINRHALNGGIPFTEFVCFPFLRGNAVFFYPVLRKWTAGHCPLLACLTVKRRHSVAFPGREVFSVNAGNSVEGRSGCDDYGGNEGRGTADMT